MKNEDVCWYFGKKLKAAYRIQGNPIEIPTIRKNQFRVLRSLFQSCTDGNCTNKTRLFDLNDKNNGENHSAFEIRGQ